MACADSMAKKAIVGLELDDVGRRPQPTARTISGSGKTDNCTSSESSVCSNGSYCQKFGGFNLINEQVTAELPQILQ